MTEIQRPAGWMVKALALLSGRAPSRLDSTVYPMIDTWQGGQADAVWTASSLLMPTITGAMEYILSPDTENIRLVRVSFRKSGALGSATVAFVMKADGTLTLSTPPHLVHYNVGSLTADGTLVSWGLIGAGALWWVLPPRASLGLWCLAGNAGDSVTVSTIVCTVPKGSKPW